MPCNDITDHDLETDLFLEFGKQIEDPEFYNTGSNSTNISRNCTIFSKNKFDIDSAEILGNYF